MPILSALAGKLRSCLRPITWTRALADIPALTPRPRMGPWTAMPADAVSEPKRALMPALIAVQRNAQFKAKYNQLIEVGKPPKLALTAIMRRLIVLANALIRDRRQWSEMNP